MKKSYLLFLLIISVFMMSCGGHFFNPRYYYNQKDSASENEQDPPSGEVDVGGSENIPEEEDPFKVGEWNDINYRFDGNKILDFLFGASFDGKNVPVYTFFKDGTQWAVSDALTAEKKYNAKDGANKAQGYEITKATFYRYDYKNPLVDPESTYNQSERMGRFLFYRLKGEAVIVPLNNYLIAIDVYSKLVFAYGKITKTDSKLGQYYPTAFEAVELHGDKRPFYEYDPIGFMKYNETEDKLELVLYREYQEEMAKDANAFFPQVHDSTRDIAGYTDKESAGRSPYYYVNVADVDPETILEQFKGKTYGIRSGLTLYTYKFSEDGKQVTITLEHFYDGKTSEKTYDYVEVTGATSLKYGDITITGLESYAKVRDSINNVSAELDYVDPGPEFVYRVRGKVYDDQNGKYSYKFNIDGKTLEYYENGKFVRNYIFNKQDASDRAVYKEERSGSFAYWGLRLDEHEGTKDGVLYWSSGAGDTPELTKTEGVTSTPGYLNVDQSVIDFFVDEVANKVYAFRDYEGTPGDGRSLKKIEYNFSSDGQTITYVESIPKEEETSITYTLVEDKGKDAIYKDNSGTQYTFSLQSSGEDLMKNGEPAGELNFYDRGAYFLDIVVGTTYYAKDESYKYEFDGSGNLTYYYSSGKTTTYTITDKYGSSSDYTKAAYIEDGALIFKYWAIKINKTGTIVQMSTGALADANHILNSASYGYDAYLTGRYGEEEDRFINAVAGQTYKMRVKGNSTSMQYYRFSSAGNYMIHVVTNGQGQQSSSNMYYNYQAVDKDVQGKYEEQIPTKQYKTFTLKDSDNELYLENTLVGYLNYNDNGAEFMDRVAGKTFVTEDNTKKYVFSANGDYFDFYVGGVKQNDKPYYYLKHDGNTGYYDDNNFNFKDFEITLADYNGIVDGQITEGSVTAYLEVPSTFSSVVKGKTYKFRDYSGLDSTVATGKSLTLYSYVFDSEGKTLTITEESWRKEPVKTVYTLTTDNASDAVYTANGKTINVAIENNNYNILYQKNDSASSKLGEVSFTDKGPLFLDMVKGSTYIAQDNSYKYSFSEDGKTITFIYPSGEEETHTYQKIKSDDYNIAAYKQDVSVFPRYWALKLSEEGNKAEWSSGSLATADNILNSAGYGNYPAYLGDGPLVADKFLNSVGGKVFEVRNSKDSLKLDRYTFSSGGATITYEQIDWYTDKVTTTIIYEGYTKVSDTEASYSYADNSGQTATVKFSIDNLVPTTLNKGGTLAGNINYKDPGPNFVDRVKGKVYKANPSDGTYYYTFSKDGKTVVYKNPDANIFQVKEETYTFAEVDYEPAGSDNVTGSRAIYTTGKGGLQYFGIKLIDENGSKDIALYMTATGWSSPGTTPAENADSRKAYRQ